MDSESNNNLESYNSNHKSAKFYDIVLYGATSFVGQLVAEYLNQFLSTQDNIKHDKQHYAG